MAGCAGCAHPHGWRLLVEVAVSVGAAMAPDSPRLLTIVDYTDATPPVVYTAFEGASCGAACTDVTNPACSCSHFGNCWSDSTYRAEPDFAWSIGFYDGAVYPDGKSNVSFGLRAVRGGH